MSDHRDDSRASPAAKRKPRLIAVGNIADEETLRRPTTDDEDQEASESFEEVSPGAPTRLTPMTGLMASAPDDGDDDTPAATAAPSPLPPPPGEHNVRDGSTRLQNLGDFLDDDDIGEDVAFSDEGAPVPPERDFHSAATFLQHVQPAYDSELDAPPSPPAATGPKPDDPFGRGATQVDLQSVPSGEADVELSEIEVEREEFSGSDLEMPPPTDVEPLEPPTMADPPSAPVGFPRSAEVDTEIVEISQEVRDDAERALEARAAKKSAPPARTGMFQVPIADDDDDDDETNSFAEIPAPVPPPVAAPAPAPAPEMDVAGGDDDPLEATDPDLGQQPPSRPEPEAPAPVEGAEEAVEFDPTLAKWKVVPTAWQQQGGPPARDEPRAAAPARLTTVLWDEAEESEVETPAEIGGGDERDPQTAEHEAKNLAAQYIEDALDYLDAISGYAGRLDSESRRDFAANAFGCAQRLKRALQLIAEQDEERAAESRTADDDD